jgi:predicted ferric reductase
MEWHPFSIASAPERKDILRLSIMKKRNWTKKVYDHFYKRLTNLNDPTDLTEITTDHSDSNSRNISLPKEITFAAEDQDAAVWIEGPFSTCTSYIFDYEHVVLIGAGIGVTPSISAIESLIHRLQAERCVCSNCHVVNYNHARLANQKLKKVDFIWVNREMGNFSWFRNILDEFENEQETYLKAIASTTNDPQEKPSRYLDIHLYCTSLRSNDQAMLENLPHDLVANMYAAIQQQDMHSKLKTPTHVGRPPWKLLFSKFKAEYKSTSVFFTGNSIMADEIKRYCDQLDFSFQHEPEF